MKQIPFPNDTEHALYYQQYLDKIPKETKVLDSLKESAKTIVTALKSYTTEQLTYTYADGKWTIKDIVQHLIDTERVFVYRAMRFARKDKTPMPFFDENAFANAAEANSVAINKLIKEFMTTRQSTLAFFNNQDSRKLKSIGIASNFNLSVRACVWIIFAHEYHHWQVVQDKYLK